MAESAGLVVFRTDYDSILKCSLKNGQSAEEALEEGLAHAWQPIVDKVAEENKKGEERE